MVGRSRTGNQARAISTWTGYFFTEQGGGDNDRYDRAGWGLGLDSSFVISRISARFLCLASRQQAFYSRRSRFSWRPPPQAAAGGRVAAESCRKRSVRVLFLVADAPHGGRSRSTHGAPAEAICFSSLALLTAAASGRVAALRSVREGFRPSSGGRVAAALAPPQAVAHPAVRPAAHLFAKRCLTSDGEGDLFLVAEAPHGGCVGGDSRMNLR